MTSKFIAEYLHLMPDVFEGVNTLKDLQNKIQKMSGHPSYSHFAGFLWEYVVAMYFYKFGEHHTVNVCDYRQTYAGTHGDDADYGIDGYGVTMKGNPILCQVKYRSDATNSIGSPKNQNSGVLDTFISEICRYYQTTDKKIVVLLCCNTIEFVDKSKPVKMRGTQVPEHISEELKERGVNTAKIIFRVYDLSYWRGELDNIRFWDFVRSSVMREE